MSAFTYAWSLLVTWQ